MVAARSSTGSPSGRLQLREAFLNVLSRPRVGLNPRTTQAALEDELVMEEVMIDTEAGETAPLVLVKSSGTDRTNRLPVLLLLHGTGKSNAFMLDDLKLFQRFARKGFLVVGMDCRYHGKRLKEEDRGSVDVYHRALVDAYRSGGKHMPFIYDNVWDLMRVVDYLLTRDDVDASRIASTGISLGGMHSWFLALADSRLATIAPAIGVQGFKFAVETNSWHGRVESIRPVFDAAAADKGKVRIDSEVVAAVWNTICPGLLDRFDSPISLPALAPLPLVIANGAEDPRCPVAGVVAAYDRARDRYEEMGARDSITLMLEEGVQHEVTENMWRAIEGFLERCLLTSKRSAM